MRPSSQLPPTRVVFDVNIYVMAVADSDPPLVRERFSIPPLDSNPGVLSISVVAQAIQDGLNTWALFVSRHILLNVIRVLKRKIDWPEPDVVEYVQFIRELADASGGGLLQPTSQLSDATEWEDNQVLALVHDSGAALLVSEDTELLHMSPWRGKPIIRAERFGMRGFDARRWQRPPGG